MIYTHRKFLLNSLSDFIEHLPDYIARLGYTRIKAKISRKYTINLSYNIYNKYRYLSFLFLFFIFHNLTIASTHVNNLLILVNVCLIKSLNWYISIWGSSLKCEYACITIIIISILCLINWKKLFCIFHLALTKFRFFIYLYI